jgi:hypothetical protein
MDFHLSLTPQPLPVRIELRDPILLSGSCFTEHMASRLKHFKFPVLENPNGILFNPVSLSQSLTRAVDGHPYRSDELFCEHGLWSSWDFHSRFSDPDPQSALESMNRSVAETHAFLGQAKWAMLTFGSAYVYQLDDRRIVANCHKVPAARFRRRLLSVEETMSALDTLVHRLFRFNPSLRLILTVSPVRHLRDGFVENSRSKAVLIQSVHQLADKFDRIHYFPAYELVIDDLRDYRFYAEDMVHPNYQATGYVWEKFAESSISGASREAMKEIDKIRAAMSHRPLHPTSEQHRQFREKHLRMATDLALRMPFLDLWEEIGFFSS